MKWIRQILNLRWHLIIHFGNVVPYKTFDVRFIDVIGIGLGLIGFFM